MKRKLLKLLKRTSYLVLTGFMTFTCLTSAFAETALPKDLEKVESGSTGSITIQLADTEENASKENVEVGIIQIADIEGGLYYQTDKFKEIDVDLNAIETNKELDEAAQKFHTLIADKEMTPDFQIKTNPEGIGFYKGLSVGVYLIYPIDIADYDHIAPVIIAIPTFDEVEGEMMYNVTAYPKHWPVVSDIKIKKVDADDQNKVLKKAEFTLYDADKKELETVATDENGIATFEDYKRGTYYLRETKAPQGYKLSKEEVKVVIDTNYDEDTVYQVTISNELLPLISTGDSNFVTTFAVLGCGSLAIILFITIKKRKDKASANQ